MCYSSSPHLMRLVINTHLNPLHPFTLFSLSCSLNASLFFPYSHTYLFSILFLYLLPLLFASLMSFVPNCYPSLFSRPSPFPSLTLFLPYSHLYLLFSHTPIFFSSIPVLIVSLLYSPLHRFYF